MINIALTFGSRELVREVLERRWKAGIGLKRILIAGAGDLGRVVAEKILCEGESLPGDGRDPPIGIDPASFEDQIFAAAIGFDQPAPSCMVEGLHGPEVRHAGLHLSAASWIGRRAAKRRKDGKKRAETLKTVDADW